MVIKDHSEIIGIPAALFGMFANYIEYFSDLGQLIATWLGCAVAFVSLVIKIKQLTRADKDDSHDLI